MTTHTPTTCSDCIAGHFKEGKDIEYIICRIKDRAGLPACTVIAHKDIDSVEDYPVPVDCPLYAGDYMLTLNKKDIVLTLNTQDNE